MGRFPSQLDGILDWEKVLAEGEIEREEVEVEVEDRGWLLAAGYDSEMEEG